MIIITFFQLDGDVLRCWGLGEWLEKDSMIQEFCEFTQNDTEIATATTVALYSTTYDLELTTLSIDPCPANSSEVGVADSCNFLFYQASMSDSQVGIILLIASLVMLCTALIIIVKILNSMLKGTRMVKISLNLYVVEQKSN